MSKNLFKASAVSLVCLIIFGCTSKESTPVSKDPDITRVGKGGYRNQPSRGDRQPPEAKYITGEMLQKAPPTNQWYSSVMFTQWSEVIHAHPLTFKASQNGLEMGLPKKTVVPTQRKDVEIFYPHEPDLIFAPTGFKPESAKLKNHGDWSIDMAFVDGENQMTSTISHGSPFTYFTLSGGDFQVKPSAGFEVSEFKSDSRVLLVKNQSKTYAIFGPSGSLWSSASGTSDDSPKKPTFGKTEQLVIYDGRLNAELNWSSYNPEGHIRVTDSDGDSVFFMDREDREDKYLQIRKKGLNGNVFTVFGEEQGPQRADLSYWAAQGELVFDLRINSAEEGVEFLVKLDSGWPNVSDYSVKLPEKGAWETIRIPVRDILANSNRFSPGGYADINKMVNLVVLEPTGTMSADVDNIRFEINPELAPQDKSGWVLSLPKDKKYVSAAILPNSRPVTVRYFQRSAYTFVTNTIADWKIDHQKSEVITNFKTISQQYEGFSSPPIVGLYPHHYFNNSSLPKKARGEIESIRGPIKLFAVNNFKTTIPYPGFVPYWPGLENEDAIDSLETQLSRDSARARSMILEIGWGPYWQGKGLQRITQLMSIADVENEHAIRDRLLKLTKKRLEKWISGESNKTYFHYDKNVKSVVSYPEEYDAVRNLNDHHFHYGYWIRAASDITLRDPEWGKSENWGGMIDLLVADIATSERGRTDFPYIRSFDPYEGHGWAGGTGMDSNGNNQESSSESLNAWAALILWGTVSNKPSLVDLGIYLYSTEIQSVNHYWFDIYGITHPKEFINEDVSILFGGKLAHTTWWTDEPRQIHGINLLPLTTSSTYLATNSDYIIRKLEALEREMMIYSERGKVAKPKDIWQDLFAKYYALADPEKGFESWNEYGSFELGDTRSHTLHWLSFLREKGKPNLDISADTKLYAVFENKQINTRTYLVFNPKSDIKNVRFSDGYILEAKPKSLTKSTKKL